MKNHLKISFPLILVLIEICMYLSNDMYLSAMPTIAKDLQTSSHLTQFSITSWFLGLAFFFLFIGPISDRFGRRPVALSGLILFIISTFSCGMAPNIYFLLVARFFQGASVAFIVIAGYACVHESNNQKDAVIILAWMSSLNILAPAFGPLLGALMLWKFPWPVIFFSQMVVALLLLPMLYRIMPETLKIEDRHSLRFRKIFQSYFKVMNNSEFLRNVLTLSSLFSAFIAWIAAGPFIVMQVFHYSAIQFGILQCIVFIAYIIGTKIVNRSIHHYTLHQITQVGLFLTSLGAFTGFLFVWLISNNVLLFIINFMIFSAGSGMTFAIMSRLAIESSTEPMGARMSVFEMFVCNSGVLGTLLAGIFPETLYAFSTIMVILIICGILAQFFLKQKA